MTLLTVITPAYNADRTIERAMASVLGQTFRDFQYVVVVDGATDDTAAKCRALAQTDSRIEVVELEKNSGAANARNVGLRHASGRYVSFLDSDDVWRDDFLDLMLRALAVQPDGCVGAFCGARLVDEDLRPLGSRRRASGPIDLLSFLEALSPHSCGSTFLVEADSIRAAGGIREAPVGHDTELLLALLASQPGAFLYALPLALVTYVKRSNSLSTGPAKHRLASYDYRLTRYLPLLPPAERATAAYTYLKRAICIGEPAWAAKWARHLVKGAVKGQGFNFRKIWRMVGTAVVTFGRHPLGGLVLVKLLRYVMRRNFALQLPPSATDERTFEMQCFAPDGRRQINPYAPLLGTAVSRLGWKPARAVIPAVWHIHWMHLYIFRRNPKTRRNQIAWIGVWVLLTRLAARRLLGKQNVWTVHNLLSHERRFARFERFERAVTALATRLVDDFVVHSEAAASQLRAAYPASRRKRIHCIPHPSFVGFYPDAVGREEARRRLDMPANALIVLSLGLIRAYKGHAELIEAFRKIPAPDARLIIAGPPHGEPQLLEGLTDAAEKDPRIRIVPSFVPDEAVQLYLRAADLAAFTYRDILTSGGIALAQSFGVPCLAPAFPTLREQLRGAGAFFYDPNVPQSLATQLSQAFAERETLAARGERHRQQVERVTWDEAARRLSAVSSARYGALKFGQRR